MQKLAGPRHVNPVADAFDVLQRSPYEALHGIGLIKAAVNQECLSFQLGGRGFSLTRSSLHEAVAASVIDAATARERSALHVVLRCF